MMPYFNLTRQSRAVFREHAYVHAPSTAHQPLWFAYNIQACWQKASMM